MPVSPALSSIWVVMQPLRFMHPMNPCFGNLHVYIQSLKYANHQCSLILNLLSSRSTITEYSHRSTFPRPILTYQQLLDQLGFLCNDSASFCISESHEIQYYESFDFKVERNSKCFSQHFLPNTSLPCFHLQNPPRRGHPFLLFLDCSLNRQQISNHKTSNIYLNQYVYQHHYRS